MKILRSALLAIAVGAVSVGANASITPQDYGYDARVQYFNYNPDDVFVIGTDVGVSTLIQLEDGERINGESTGLGMGDADAWSLAVKGNNIFLKPTDFLPDTNMVIVTNKRTYAVQLTTNKFSPSYIVRFKYPDIKDESEGNEPAKEPPSFRSIGEDANGQPILIAENINTNYFKRGEEAILPTNVWDDGVFTFMKYPNNKDLPVFYRVLADGTESLVNSHVSDDTVIIHETSPLYRLRLGASVAELSNIGFDADGKFNDSGTTTGDFREVK